MVFLQIWKVCCLYEVLKCKHGSCGGGSDWNVNQSGLFAEILLVQWIQNFIVFFCLPPFAISYFFVTTDFIFSMNLSIKNFVPMEEDTLSKSFFLDFYHKRENSLDQKVLPIKVSVHVRIQLLSTLQISYLSYEFVRENKFGQKLTWKMITLISESKRWYLKVKRNYSSFIFNLLSHFSSFPQNWFLIWRFQSTFFHMFLNHFFILASTVGLFNGCTTSTNFGL